MAHRGRAYVAYRVHAGVALALGDPVVAPGGPATAVADFAVAVRRSGWTPCLFSVGARAGRAAGRRDGWRSLQVAEDTLIDLDGLEFKGKAWQAVRSAFNRADKSGIEHRMVHLAEEPRALVAQVRAISEEWVGDKGLPEMGFTLGGVDEALDSRGAHRPRDRRRGHRPRRHVLAAGLRPDAGDRRLDARRHAAPERRVPRRRRVPHRLGLPDLPGRGRPVRLAVRGAAGPLGPPDETSEPVLDRLLDALGAALEPYYGFRSLHSSRRSSARATSRCTSSTATRRTCRGSAIALTRAYLPDADARDLLRLATTGRE